MTARKHDNSRPGRYNNNRPGNSRPPGRGRATRTGTVPIAGHETRIMTPEQHDNAVEALAALLRRWAEDHHGPCPHCTPDPGEQPAAA